ncbi:MAG: ABC transporter substrate-binding protein [Acetobacteraceae bacterium]|nr:ABC transporter substrate-binding protein [Acetobacteraceae bacterium]
MVYRRRCLVAGLLVASSWAGFGLFGRGAQAQAVEKAVAFVQQTGDRLTAIVNGPKSTADKRRALNQILEVAVDVDGIARFCLGRFWRSASPDQKKRYVAAFHDVLVTNISAKLGEYQGVKLTVQKGRQQEEEAVVTTIVERPNNPPNAVDWVIGQAASAPKIIDVVAEGTSLRLTQRQDYASYLSRNNNDIDLLVTAMIQQTAKSR